MEGEEWRALLCRDTYHCDREVSQQLKLRARGIVDRHLGLQQAQLQKPNGGDDSTEVEENHGGEPKRGPPNEKGKGGGQVIFSDMLFFCHPLKKKGSLFFFPKEVSNFRQAIILIIYANPT